MTDYDNSLKTEWEFFDAHREEYVKMARGKFVVIKGEKNYGFFDDEDEAFDFAFAQFHGGPFMVHEVQPEDVLRTSVTVL